MKIVGYVGAVLGLALLIALVVHADAGAIVQTLSLGGWALLWLVPFRAVYFLLYAIGWRGLVQPYDPQHRAGLAYLFWVTTVREGIDRLLPVASVGGGVAGVRLLGWRGIAAVPASATVMVEILLTLMVLYLFTALGLVLLWLARASGADYHRVLVGFALTLPMPILMAALLRYGSVFERLERWLAPLVGAKLAHGAASLDQELRTGLRRVGTLAWAGALQCIAWSSGAAENWYALRLFHHPIDARTALIMESMAQALRHLAFIVPGGLGVQEAGMVIFGQMLGVSPELALATSAAKRLREILCGVPALLSWQWCEWQRLHGRRTQNG